VLEREEEEIHVTTTCQWHERLGHETLSHMRKEGIMDGLDFVNDFTQELEEI
jgi:hypothetical protein